MGVAVLRLRVNYLNTHLTHGMRARLALLFLCACSAHARMLPPVRSFYDELWFWYPDVTDGKQGFNATANY